MIWTLWKCNKKVGSPCLFTRQQALKMGYFYLLGVKSSNHLHTELNLGYLKGTKVCLGSKASFVDISSIASLKPFLIAWLREYCTFRKVLWLTWSPRLGQNTPIWEPFSKINHVLLSNFFSFSNMFFIRLFLANTWKQNRGSPCSFKRKGEFIPLPSLVWGKSLTLNCMCTRSCARADDTKIVRSRDVQCNTKELP